MFYVELFSKRNPKVWECGPSRSGPSGPAKSLQGSGVFVCGVQMVLTPSGARIEAVALSGIGNTQRRKG